MGSSSDGFYDTQYMDWVWTEYQKYEKYEKKTLGIKYGCPMESN